MSLGAWGPGEPTDPWFKVGRVEVTTVVGTVAAVIVSWFLWVFPAGLPESLVLWMPSVLNGELWRIVTWPAVNGISIWTLFGLFVFWYVGTAIEIQIGRSAMLRLLAGIWLALTATHLVISLLLGPQALAGFGLIQFAVLLLWIAEYPNRPFFFGIKAWVVGAALVALQVLPMLAAQDFVGILTLLVSLIAIAMVARRIGLLNEYAWIPGRKSARESVRRANAHTASTRANLRHHTDRERLDVLLDKISDHGLHSLTNAERRELKKLSERLRGRF